MKASDYEYVTTEGSLYRMTPLRFRAFLRAVAADKGWPNPNNFGTYLGECQNITDLRPQDARGMLKYISNAAREARAGSDVRTSQEIVRDARNRIGCYDD